MFDRGPFRALATLLFAVTLPGTLIAQPTKQVGTIGGSFDVTLSGTSTYTIPIRLAPGAAGTEPKLALTYDSQSPSGSLGAGWSITGISAITRGPKTRFADGVVEGVDLEIGEAHGSHGGATGPGPFAHT